MSRRCYFVPFDAHVPGEGYRASVVVEHEHGHRPTGNWPYNDAPGQVRPYFWGHDYTEACRIAAVQNKRLGLSEQDVTAIVASSMQKMPRRP